MLFRNQLNYPPAGTFTAMTLSGADALKTEETIRRIFETAKRRLPVPARFLGPSEMSIYKLKDMFRQVLYFKTGSMEDMILVKRLLEEISEEIIGNERLFISFER